MNGESSSTTSTPGSFDTETVSEAVVTAVADAKGVSTVDVTPPLYNVIDPDALEAVIASLTRRPDESAGRVTFSYSGYEVIVTGDRHVSVTPDDPTTSKQSSRN